jgi:tetratricopeptide (TPR) repeat protein
MRATALAMAVSLLACVPVFAQVVPEHQRLQAQQHFRTGEQLMAAERFTEAEEAFGRAVRADRLLAHAHYRQGQAFMALHRFPSAIRAFSASRDAHRELLGLVQRERLQALSQRPGAHVRFQVPAELSLALGSAYFRNGELTDAEREWKEAIEANPRFGEAHNNLCGPLRDDREKAAGRGGGACRRTVRVSREPAAQTGHHESRVSICARCRRPLKST